MLPPTASIAFLAEAETETPSNVSFLESEPLPRILIDDFLPFFGLKIPLEIIEALFTVSPFAKANSIEPKLTANGLSLIDLKAEIPRPRSLGYRLMKSRISGRFLRPALAF
jgi:hypothetical protein